MGIRREDVDGGRMDFAAVIDRRRGRVPLETPGAYLRHDVLEPLGLSAYRLAKDIGVPLNRITAILDGKRAISADTALRLGKYFGMSPQFWLGLQMDYDLRRAQATMGDDLDAVPRRAA